jgi:inorganic pyrophosphatase
MSPSDADFPNIVEVVVEIPAAAATSTSGTRRPASSVSIGSSPSAVHSPSITVHQQHPEATATTPDALLLIDEPTFPGCRVWARPIGGLAMSDEHGVDFKVLCVAVGDPHQAHVESLDQVRPHRRVEIEHIFNTYKLLEAKETDVLGWRDAGVARDVLVADRSTWQAERRGGDRVGAPGG